MGRVKCDHIKRLITLTTDNIKRLSLYLYKQLSNYVHLKLAIKAWSYLATHLKKLTTPWLRTTDLDQCLCFRTQA